MAEETKETKKIIPESKKKHKKKHKKKKVLLKVSVVFLLLVVIGWFTFGAKVMKLRSEAKKLVAQSSEETFKASQTSIVYDTNGKQLLKFKGEKDVYYYCRITITKLHKKIYLTKVGGFFNFLPLNSAAL